MRQLAVMIWYCGVALLGIGIFLILTGILMSAVVVVSGLFCALFGSLLFMGGGKLWQDYGLQHDKAVVKKMKSDRGIL